jgi:hypothetical protein
VYKDLQVSKGLLVFKDVKVFKVPLVLKVRKA